MNAMILDIIHHSVSLTSTTTGYIPSFIPLSQLPLLFPLPYLLPSFKINMQRCWLHPLEHG